VALPAAAATPSLITTLLTLDVDGNVLSSSLSISSQFSNSSLTSRERQLIIIYQASDDERSLQTRRERKAAAAASLNCAGGRVVVGFVSKCLMMPRYALCVMLNTRLNAKSPVGRDLCPTTR